MEKKKEDKKERENELRKVSRRNDEKEEEEKSAPLSQNTSLCALDTISNIKFRLSNFCHFITLIQ